MSINLDVEKQRKLSTQDMYDILHFAAQSAEDNGFVNSFVFERALFEYAAIILYPDRKDEIAKKVSDGINAAWDYLLDDGTIDDMYDNYKLDIDMLAEEGNIWLSEFTKYLHSARGLLNTFQTFSGDIVKSAVEQFKTASKNTNVQEILDIADKWGMNNNPERVETAEKTKLEIIDGEVKEDKIHDEKEVVKKEKPLFEF